IAVLYDFEGRLPIRPDIPPCPANEIRNVIAISLADERQQMIGAEDHAAATRGSAVTLERAHGRTTEGCVVDRQFLPGPNVAARHQVQAVEPGEELTVDY